MIVVIIIFDTVKHQYLTSNVNSLFSLKRDFMRTSGGKKEKLPTKNDEESSLVAEVFEISNRDLIRDIDYIFKQGKDLSLMR